MPTDTDILLRAVNTYRDGRSVPRLTAAQRPQVAKIASASDVQAAINSLAVQPAPEPAPAPAPEPAPAPAPAPVPSEARPRIAKVAYGTGTIPSYAGKWDIVILSPGNAAAIPKLKAMNPSMKVLAYQNLTMVKPAGNAWVEIESGVQYQTALDKGYLTGVKNSYGLYQADIRKAGYKEDWLAGAKRHVGAGFDGVFMDDFSPSSHWQPSLAGPAWTQALHDLINYVRANSSWLLIPNMDGAWGAHVDEIAPFLPEVSAGFDEMSLTWPNGGSQAQNYIDGELRAMAQARAAGKPYLATTNITSTSDTQRALAGYAFAAIGGASHYLPSPAYGFASIYLPEFDYDLGAPTGAYTRVGTVYKREFEKATVTVDVAALTGSVVLR